MFLDVKAEKMEFSGKFFLHRYIFHVGNDDVSSGSSSHEEFGRQHMVSNQGCLVERDVLSYEMWLALTGEKGPGFDSWLEH